MRSIAGQSVDSKVASAILETFLKSRSGKDTLLKDHSEDLVKETEDVNKTEKSLPQVKLYMRLPKMSDPIDSFNVFEGIGIHGIPETNALVLGEGKAVFLDFRKKKAYGKFVFDGEELNWVRLYADYIE